MGYKPIPAGFWTLLSLHLLPYRVGILLSSPRCFGKGSMPLFYMGLSHSAGGKERHPINEALLQAPKTSSHKTKDMRHKQPKEKIPNTPEHVYPSKSYFRRFPWERCFITPNICCVWELGPWSRSTFLRPQRRGQIL